MKILIPIDVWQGNDSLAQDEDIFKLYYPEAKLHVFHETGHYTPFIQFENMVKVINDYLEK